ncbi:long-chain acyl-CoA synthetase [Acrasis kona]|uniref:Long-chain acyl-CoA synthetase n=1 Tax=Acrasis kona TaxID=1008807 RepID=A0AAW2YYU8_9EUKA
MSVRSSGFGGLATATSDERKTSNVDKQSVDIGNHVHRRSDYENAILIRRYEDVATCYHSFKRSVEKNGSRNCMGKRAVAADGTVGDFQFITYETAGKRSKDFGSGLRHIGVEPNTHLGIFSKNCIEWQLTSEACHTQSIVTIALYDTLGEESSLFIMNHGEIVCLCIGATEFEPSMKIAAKCEHLKTIICFDSLSEEQIKRVKDINLAVYNFEEVEKLGQANPVPDVPPTPETLATIMYTSGTTGMPKGVMLSHMNIIACITGVLHQLFEITNTDVLLSYLPLAHILERVAEMAFFQSGAAIGFFQGDVRKLVDDMKSLLTNSTARCSSLNAIFLQATGLKKFLIERAVAAKKQSIVNNTTTPIWDRLVFNKVKESTGGRLRGVLSGGAPLSSTVQDFLRVVLGCPIVQGYGLTETTAGGTVQLFYANKSGNIGPPIGCCEIKLESVPEMNYSADADPPSGEICIRGPNVSSGYFKDPEKTAEVFDQDGWFHTGDIGMWNKDGTLTITDRLKNIFKLSQGEYVAAENLENKMGSSPWVARLWVYGDSFKAVLVGVVVVNLDTLRQWAKENQIDDSDVNALIADGKVNQLVMQDLTTSAKNANLKGFEFIKAVHLVSQDFDSFGGTTPTMKLKRNVLKEHFQPDIDRMYNSLEQKEQK